MTDANERLHTRAERSRRYKLQALGRELAVRLELRDRELELAAQLASEKHQAAEKELELQNRLAATELQAAARERELNAQLEALRLEIQGIVNSRSWKITQPMRDLVLFAKTGSLRSSGSPLTGTPAPDISSWSGPVQPETSSPNENIINVGDDVAGTVGNDLDPVVDESGSHESDLVIDAAESSKEQFATRGRGAWDEAGRDCLDALLRGEQSLMFPLGTGQPVISIIIALYNKAHLGVLCLESILRNADVSYEVILIDNASSDETGRILERLSGVEIIRNEENLGFGYACVQGAERARGEYLCFLNNDAILRPGGLSAVIEDFRDDERIGAIGGKILLADGRLQEAGSMIWNDGSAWGYGRGDDPQLPKYEFRRPVDYCSGAFLFTPRALFHELAGFDPRFLPAYYEDTDYCMKVWAKGLKVVYEPRAVIHHYESASLENAEAAKAPIALNQGKFVAKWQQQLGRHLTPTGENVPYARIAASAEGLRILFIDDAVPHREPGPEFAHSHDTILQLVAQKHYVTCVSNSHPLGENEYTDIPRDVEMANAIAAAHFLFRELLPRYDAVWIRGRSNAEDLLRRLRDVDDRFPLIIYDAGAVAAQPEGENASKADGLDEDKAAWLAADVIFVRCERDRQLLQGKGFDNVRVFSEDAVAQLLSEIPPREGIVRVNETS